MPARIGVDVGGTFTDLIYLDDATGQVTVGKGPSNPSAVDQAVRAVVSSAVDDEGVAASSYFLHGTTVGLNALLERKGARVAILTTEGFRDVLEVRRLMRIDENGEHMWDHLFKTPEPLVSRPLRVGVPERVLADGSARARCRQRAYCARPRRGARRCRRVRARGRQMRGDRLHQRAREPEPRARG